MTLAPVEGDERDLIAEARAEGAVLLIIDGTYPDDVQARLLYNSMGDLTSSSLVTDPLTQLVRAARLDQRGLRRRWPWRCCSPSPWKRCS